MTEKKARKKTTVEDAPPVEKKPPKPLTEIQLFSTYTRALKKIRGMAETLAEETAKVERMQQELADRFQIYVTGQRPRLARKPAERPLMNDPVAGIEDAAEGPEYKPPAQYHADPVTINPPDTSEVDRIRSEAMTQEEDSEALAADGANTMAGLMGRMRGQPTAVAQPGAHEPGARPVERSNAGGGPVIQRPAEES